MKATYADFGRQKLASLALIPVALLIILVVYALNIQTTFDPPFLFPILNTTFTGLIPLIVAYIAFRSYQQHGSPGILFIGAGMLAYGIGSIAAPIAATLPDGINLIVTIHNCGALVGALFQMSGALLLFSGPWSAQDGGRIWKSGLTYGTILLVLAGIILGAVQETMPPFFVPDTGFTVLRTIVLMSGIEFFVIAAVLFYLSYIKKGEEFLFWYSIGIALIAVGLFSATLVSAPGNPLSWVTRSTQYLGTCFVLVAFLTVRIEALQRNIPLEAVLFQFFGEAETRYKSLVDTATDAIVVFDSADRVIVWNRSAETMFGYSRSEAVGSSFFRLAASDESADRIKNTFLTTATNDVSSGPQRSMEIFCRRKDGSTFPTELALSRHVVAGAWVFTCIIRDLTERRRAQDELLRKNEELNALNEDLVQTEKTLREAEERFHRIFERSPFGIVIGDTDGRMIESNPAFESMLGYSKEELMNMNFADFTDQSDLKGEQVFVNELLAGKRDTYAIDKHYLRKDGRTILVRLVGTTIRGSDEGPIMGLAMVEDVTQQRQAAEDLNRSLAEKEILLAEIHHRVKNNLTAFISLLSLEGSTEETPVGREIKKDLQNRARSMALIHETLYRTHQFSNVDMDAYLKPLIDQISKSYLSSQSIRTIVDTKGVALDIIRATPIGLIVTELVTNSLRHAFPQEMIAFRESQKEPCVIGIQLTNEEGSYLLKVFDNGIGMPAGFDPLTAKSLGLKLVNFLAKHQLRAKIHVNTGKGTEFIFYLDKK